MLRNLFYVGLEAYPDRYTYQLQRWAFKQMSSYGCNFHIVPGLTTLNTIKTGQVLDAVQRSIHSIKQIDYLLRKMQLVNWNEHDFIFFEDMFHPGIESLFYAFNQFKHAGKAVPKIGMRCLAQTIDPDDFVHYTQMAPWMRHYEAMVNEYVDCLFVASTEMLGYMRAAGWSIPAYVTGLPFCIDEVLTHVNHVIPWNERTEARVVFASRIADEKQPNFLGAFALLLQSRRPKAVVEIVTGGPIPDLTKYPLLQLANQRGAVAISAFSSKEHYYSRLNKAKLLFNCSLQDWVSNTASEADTLGCNLLFPAYRSFPEAFDNDPSRMYVPWSLEDAVEKALPLLDTPYKQGLFSQYQNGTNERTLAAMEDVVQNNPKHRKIPCEPRVLSSITALRNQLERLGLKE